VNKVLESIKNRRSIRKYLEDQIKDEELEIILEAAVYAPTAGNEQSWHFTVIQNAEFIDTMNLESKKLMLQNKELMDKINLESKKLTENMSNRLTKMGESLNFNIFYQAHTKR
jgi:nitroreductase